MTCTGDMLVWPKGLPSPWQLATAFRLLTARFHIELPCWSNMQGLLSCVVTQFALTLLPPGCRWA